MQARSPFFTRQAGLHELLYFCKTLTPPPEVIINGVIPKETELLSMQLSEMVERRLGEIINKLIEEVNHFRPTRA
jgi:hypothetical protein